MARRLLQHEGYCGARRQGTSEVFYVGTQPRLAVAEPQEQRRGASTSQASGLGCCTGYVWFSQGAPESLPWALLAQESGPSFQLDFLGGVISGQLE